MTAEDTASRSDPAPFRRFSVGAAEINESERSVTVDGVSTSLTDLSWRFLLTLLEQSPNPASVDTLCREVWNSPHVSAETIAQRARQVRQALGDDPRTPRFIRTIRGGGYQLIPPVELINPVEPDDDRVPLSEPNGRRWQRQAMVASALIVLLTWITWSRVNSTPETPSTGPQLAESSIAVSSDSPISNTPLDLVENSELESASELVARADDYRLRGVYDSNEIAIDLYQRALTSAPDYPPALIGLSLSLSHKTAKYDFAPAFAARGADLADRALVLDPNSSAAWAARGLADDARGRVASAMDYYQRAADMDPQNPRFISNLAYLKQVQGYLHESLKLESRALSKGPPTFFADFQIAVALRLAGLNKNADWWLDRAATLRPDNVFLLGYRVQQLIQRDRFEEALELLAGATVNLNEHDFLRGLALRGAGLGEESVSAFRGGQRHAQERGRDCVACSAMLVQLDDPEAVAALDGIKQRASEEIAGGDQWPFLRLELAMLAAAEGDEPGANRYLREAVALGYRDLPWLKALQRLGALPAGPEATRLLNEIDEQVREQRALIESDRQLAGLLNSQG